MKSIKFQSWILLIVLILTLGACQNDNDDLILANPIGTNGNGGNNGGGSTGGGGNGGSTVAGTEGEITLYSVSAETIQKIRDYQVSGQNLVYQQDVTEHQRLWSLTKKVVPLNHREKMNEFMIFNFIHH